MFCFCSLFPSFSRAVALTHGIGKVYFYTMECFHTDNRITPNKGWGGAVQVFMRQCVTESSLGSHSTETPTVRHQAQARLGSRCIFS